MVRKVFWRRPKRRPEKEILSDKELARTLRERIAGELPVSGRNRLRFYVREGVVTIYGSVFGSKDRVFVKHLVRHTPGVATVYDHLTVEEHRSEPPTHL
ncbi:MAG: BON domain-containing protein [Rhodothermales bacterium]|jgi:osmotically-inducible protein OsmY